MRKYVLYLLIVVFTIALSVNNHSVIGAESIKNVENKIKELEKEQNDLKSKQSEIDSSKRKVMDEMDENIDKQISVQNQMNEIEDKLTTTRANISAKESEIEKTTKEINELTENIRQLKLEISELEKRIQIRDELLRDRLRSIQESGGKVQYISVVLGSQSFSDFISRSTTVNAIMDQDKNIMEEHAADQLALEQKKEEVEKKRKLVESKKIEQEKQKEKLQSLKNQLDEQKAEKERLKEQLKEEYEELEEYNLSLEEENQIIEEQAIALEKAKQLAESEKAKLEQEERERQAKLANQHSKASTSHQNSSGNHVITGGSGSFIWPASGRFSSGFGPRWGTQHNGIDIAASRGTPVVASASGVVSTVVSGCVEGNRGCGGGYGNYIIVTHYVNGSSFATLYAHLSSVSVSVGQTVSQGEQIGGIGHTGHSTGPHLHFEIHPGGYKNPVNPLNYLK